MCGNKEEICWIVNVTIAEAEQNPMRDRGIVFYDLLYWIPFLLHFSLSFDKNKVFAYVCDYIHISNEIDFEIECTFFAIPNAKMQWI